MTKLSRIGGFLWGRSLEAGPVLLGALVAYGAIYGVLAVLASMDGVTRDFPVEVIFFFFVILTFFTMGVLLVSFGDVWSMSFGLPSHTMRLPLSTACLVFWRMVFDFAALNVVIGIAFSIVDIATVRAGEVLPFSLADVLFMVNGMFFYAQAITSVVGRSNLLWLGPCILIPPVALFWYSILDYQIPEWKAMVIGATPVAFACSLYGTSVQRRGADGPFEVFSRAFWRRIPRYFDESDRPFATPGAAQRWFEWKRIGRYFPVIAPVSTFMMLVVIWIEVFEGGGSDGRLANPYDWSGF